MGKVAFNPIQPSFEFLTNNYIETVVEIDHHIHLLFYQFKVDEEVCSYLPLAPDLCVDLVFVCDHDNPSAEICGSVTRCKKVYFQPNMTYFGMRILPEQKILQAPLLWSEFMDEQIHVCDIWDGKEDIISQTVTSSSFMERVKIVKRNFLPKLSMLSETSLIVSYCMKEMIQTGGKITVQQLSDQSGYSTRYIRQQFKKEIGISPKQFAKIIRFQYALKLMMTSQYHILDIVDQCGYYDHAHLLRELKQFNFNTLNLQQIAN